MENEVTENLASLDGAFVVLGVTGGIAAYKAVEICRALVDAGAHVAPVLTEAATRFIGVATFSALASEPAQTEIFEGDEPIPHTRLGQQADLVVIAPATATFLAEYAAGIGHELLGAVLLATEAPVIVAPAMHTEMWHHDSVKANLETLRDRGVVVVEPELGRLAGGDIGEGRLARSEVIVGACAERLAGSRDLSGMSVLVSAGGTREPIDAVRFLGNRSSGKQGHAIAIAARDRGARVILVTTADLEAPRGVAIVSVETADEMRKAILESFSLADVVIMTAAVADYRPVNPAPGKWKKRNGPLPLELEETPDILAELGAMRSPKQMIVGFAAETDDVLANGAAKLAAKSLDVLVVNDVSQPGVGFGHDTNAVTILLASGEQHEVSRGPKSTIANAVLDVVVHLKSS